MNKRMDRRRVLQFTVGAAAAAVLAACGGATVATNTPASGSTAGTAAPAGGTGGQSPVPSGTLAGGTDGQTPAVPAGTTAASSGTTASSTTASGTTAATAAATTTTGTTAATTTTTGTTAAGAASPAATTTTTGTTAAAASPASSAAAPIIMVPLNPPNATAKGNVRGWITTYDPPDLPSAQYHNQWVSSLKTTLPNVAYKEEQYAYGDMLDKLRVAVRANQAPDVAVLPILWAPEFTASNVLVEVNLADYGYSADKFWPGALKSLTWQGKLYGIPTNNETHGFIWNKAIFSKAGLDPEKPPATWEDVKNFSKQIKDKTGKAGYGIVAKLNNGDIPYRFMPLCWAHGGSALDETADNPTYQKSGFDNAGTIAALQWIYDVFVRDQSSPASALTNTGTENQNLLLSSEIAMMSGHPSTYTFIKSKAPDIAASLGYAQIPAGPVRRAVVFGGSNMVIFKTAKDVDAAKAVMKDRTMPNWSLYHEWETSNPGNRDAFSLPAQQQRLAENKYLDVTTSDLQYGISFPAIPESNDIMNLMVPQMMQDVMTKSENPGAGRHGHREKGERPDRQAEVAYVRGVG